MQITILLIGKVFISMTLKDNSKHILQPIPLELVDDEFDINEWHIEMLSGINIRKLYIKILI